MNDANAEILLAALSSEIRDMARNSGYDPEQVIDDEKLRIVLEATGGDLDLAASLYWDDFTARAQQEQQQEDDDDDDDDDDIDDIEAEVRQVAAPEVAEAVNNDDADDAENEPDIVIEAQPEQPNQHPMVEEEEDIARRLDGDFEALAAHAQNAGMMEGANDGQLARFIAHAREAVRRLGAQANEPNAGRDNDVDHVPAIAARAAQALLAAGADPNESVSISDDESGGAWKKVSGVAEKLKSATQDSQPSPPQRKRHKKHEPSKSKSDLAKGETVASEDYLSDDDWILESLEADRTTVPLQLPMEMLWGLPSRNRSSGDAGESGGSNVIADEEGDNERGAEGTGIPKTWMASGFQLSECATGLVLGPPNEEDIPYLRWQQNQRTTPRNLSPPYHCRAITALLSIVTSVMYTGASIQGHAVTTSSSRKPFVELDKDQRRCEFEARLADALSALLFIAISSANKRKLPALRVYQKSKDEADKRNWKMIERKLRLCPTCAWEQDANSGEIRISEDGEVQVSTSFSNIEDLRLYVLSNMRHFTASGGCALFLETIIRIHGKGAVSRMIRQSRRLAKLNGSHHLIKCTCEERFKKTLDSAPLSTRSFQSGAVTGAIQESHDCISLELVSLLLTGKVYSTLRGWDTGPLGVGILSDKLGEVGKGLTRPDKPVWILLGPSCYSTLWLSDSYDGFDTFSKNDLPGSVVQLTHWNAWYGHRNKTALRLVIPRADWAPRAEREELLSWSTTAPAVKSDSQAVVMLKKRRIESQIAAIERDGVEPFDPNMVFAKEELDRLVANEEDKKFYPSNYALWRYDFGEADDENLEDQKQRGQQWMPFYRMNQRERSLVETKFAPKIKTILCTRWPQSSIDKFTPEDPQPLV